MINNEVDRGTHYKEIYRVCKAKCQIIKDLTFLPTLEGYSEVPRFLQTSIFPYIGVLLVLALVTVADPSYEPVFYFICTIVTAKFGVEALKDKLTQFFKPANEPPGE